MKPEACGHLKESTLEAFLMGRLPAQIAGSIYDDSLAKIEDHLLICPSCLEAAETHDFLYLALRSEAGYRFAVAHAGF